MKKITKITTVAILSSLPLMTASAAIKVKDLGNGLKVPDFTDAELKEAGCDPTVWNKLVNQYIDSRGIKKAVEEKGREQIEMETPKNDWESCFSGALSKIDSLKKQINSVWSIFSGDFDLMEAGSAILDKYIEGGCQKINKETSSMVGSVTNPINSAIGGTVGEVSDAIDKATGIDGAGKEVFKTNDKNEETLFNTEKTTLSDVIGKDNVPTTSFEDVADKYIGILGGSSASGTTLDSLLN